MVNDGFGHEVQPPVVPHRQNLSPNDQRVLPGSTGDTTNPAMSAVTPESANQGIPDEVLSPDFNNQPTAVLPRIPKLGSSQPAAPIRIEPISQTPQNAQKPQGK